MTQTDLILSHLKRGRPLTALTALKLYQSLRLAARVFELRMRGYDIRSHLVTTKSGKHIAVYRLTVQ